MCNACVSCLNCSVQIVSGYTHLHASFVCVDVWGVCVWGECVWGGVCVGKGGVFTCMLTRMNKVTPRDQTSAAEGS